MGFTWCHGHGHVGFPKQRNGGMLVSRPNPLKIELCHYICKRFLLFLVKNMAVDHVSENQEKINPLKGF